MARLPVKVIPKASRSRIVGWLGDALKITVTAPPEGGRANTAVTELLASSLDVPTSRVRCVAGHASSRKLFEISVLTDQQVRQRLDALIRSPDAASGPDPLTES
jgi:uncharacterized protein YggU (UPF0235/DUF167 family)